MNDQQLLDLLNEGKLSLRDLLYNLCMRESVKHTHQIWFSEYQINLINKAFELIDSSKKSKT